MTTTSADLVIESSKRISGTTNAFVFELGVSIPLKSTKVSLHKVVMPWLYYNINSSNNTIIVRDTGTGFPVTVTVTPGNYTPAEIATALQTALNATANSGGTSWTVTYNPITFVYSITRTLTVYDFILGGTIRAVIGITTTANVALPAASTTAPTFGWLKQIYIQIAQFPKTYYIAQAPSTFASFSIDPSATPGTMLFYEPDPKMQEIVGISDYSLNVLHISLIDSDGNLVSINGAEWTLILRFE
jgi:hypothetical protein